MAGERESNQERERLSLFFFFIFSFLKLIFLIKGSFFNDFHFQKLPKISINPKKIEISFFFRNII